MQSCCFTNLKLLFFLPFSLPSPSSLLKLPYRPKITIIPCKQGAKKVVYDSPGQVDFVLNLPNGQVKFLEEFKLHENCEINSAHQLKMIWRLVEMTFGLVYASFSLPEWQALKNDFLCALRVRESKTVLYSRFYTVNFGFQALDSSLRQ